MSVSAAIRRMLAAGLTIEQALVAAEAFEAEAKPAEPVRTPRQARNKRYYERLKASEKRLNPDDQDVPDGGAEPSCPEGSSPTPPSPKPQSSIPPSPPKGGSSPAEFDQFWSIYPHKVGKRDAEKAFARARKRVDLETMLLGLRRYVAKNDDRPWCNPSTWLNQDRWGDAPAAPPQAKPPPGIISTATRYQSREEYLAAELRRSERSFQ